MYTTIAGTLEPWPQIPPPLLGHPRRYPRYHHHYWDILSIRFVQPEHEGGEEEGEGEKESEEGEGEKESEKVHLLLCVGSHLRYHHHYWDIYVVISDTTTTTGTSVHIKE